MFREQLVLVAGMMLLTSCGVQSADQISVRDAPGGAASADRSVVVSADPSSAGFGQPSRKVVTSTSLSFRTDVEVVDGPLASASRDVEHTVRLIDREGLQVIEITLLKVPYGTELFEVYINGRLRAGGTYVTGAVAALRADDNTTSFDVFVKAISADGEELGRSITQQLDMTGTDLTNAN